MIHMLTRQQSSLQNQTYDSKMSLVFLFRGLITEFKNGGRMKKWAVVMALAILMAAYAFAGDRYVHGCGSVGGFYGDTEIGK